MKVCVVFVPDLLSIIVLSVKAGIGAQISVFFMMFFAMDTSGVEIKLASGWEVIKIIFAIVFYNLEDSFIL